MKRETAELIMVLKGNHNLQDGLPDDIPNLGAHLHTLALYMSDRCGASFAYCQKHPGLLNNVVREAVLDYSSSCDNPRHFLRSYFEARRLLGVDALFLRDAIYNDAQCWCSALISCDIRGDCGKLVNGFTEADIQNYKRQRPFIP